MRRVLDMLPALKDGDSRRDVRHRDTFWRFTLPLRLPPRTEVRFGLTPNPRADTTCPAASTFFAAFSSRSWLAPHSLHVQSRIMRPSFDATSRSQRILQQNLSAYHESRPGTRKRADTLKPLSTASRSSARASTTRPGSRRAGRASESRSGARPAPPQSRRAARSRASRT